MAKGQTEGVCGKYLRFTPSVSLTLDSSPARGEPISS